MTVDRSHDNTKPDEDEEHMILVDEKSPIKAPVINKKKGEDDEGDDLLGWNNWIYYTFNKLLIYKYNTSLL